MCVCVCFETYSGIKWNASINIRYIRIFEEIDWLAMITRKKTLDEYDREKEI